MLQQVLEGTETSSLVVIEDCVEHDGRPVFHCFCSELAKRCASVHLFHLEKPADCFLEGANVSKIHLHDGFSDPLLWEEQNRDSSEDRIDLTSAPDFLGHVKKLSVKTSPVAVVIDSLTPYLLHCPGYVICRALHRLLRARLDSDGVEIALVVAGFHGDLHDDSTAVALRHMATTWVQLQEGAESPTRSREGAESPTQDRACFHGTCEVLHRRKSGKVIRQDEEYHISAQWSLTSRVQKAPVRPAAQPDQESQVDPTANLTFNLRLTDTEKEARSRVVLPYMHHQRKKAPDKPAATPGGQIFYQPDDVDDFDEEDPDDDLDF
ncbi:PREDICTED: elongator complex protein 5-like isoform X1 [Branchiostoma belcheri]|uniref:Elongator complex protein 5 n=1 Tax=Branchiostoma belcheri TaxID=7741 RepID=A0A6P4YFQ6_BRABE|nr:PREDICTED: elongator complex protein 5-like isoform X1 [Branchiostoma belcheri]